MNKTQVKPNIKSFQTWGREYLSLSKTGKNDLWRYVLSFSILGLFESKFNEPIVTWVFKILSLFPSDYILFVFLEELAPMALLEIIRLFIIWFILNFIHQRKMITLIEPSTNSGKKNTKDLKVFGNDLVKGFTIYGIILIIGSIIKFNLGFQYSWGIAESEYYYFSQWVMFGIYYFPLQVAYEELLLRGYLMQTFSLLSKNRILCIVFSSLAFSFWHLQNPEVNQAIIISLLTYFVAGCFFCLLILRTGRLWLAYAVHLVNNYFYAFLANYDNSAMSMPSVFRSEFSPLVSLVMVVINALIFWFVCFTIPELLGKQQNVSSSK